MLEISSDLAFVRTVLMQLCSGYRCADIKCTNPLRCVVYWNQQGMHVICGTREIRCRRSDEVHPGRELNNFMYATPECQSVLD